MAKEHYPKNNLPKKELSALRSAGSRGLAIFPPKNIFRFIITSNSCLPLLTWLWSQKKALSKSFSMVYILSKSTYPLGMVNVS